MTLPLSESTHDSLIELLPWYVNGTLPADEQRAVEEHLVGCAECRGDVDALSRVSHAIHNDSPAPLVPPMRAENLLDALDEPEHKLLGFPNWLMYAAAASVAIALVTIWVNLQSETTSAESPVMFETATSAAADESISYVVEITFAAETTADGRDASLTTIGAVGGISHVGGETYRVTLTPAPASLAYLEQRIDEIEAHPQISSARVVAVQLPVD